VLSLFLSAILVLGFSSLNEAFSDASGKTINSGVGTPTIDGVLSSGEWDNAGTLDFDANVFGGGTTPARIFVLDDGNNLYVAIRVDRTALDAFNFAGIVFDNDHGGETSNEVGDDRFELLGGTFRDFFWTGSGFDIDTSAGGNTDGSGSQGNDSTFTVYEFSHPLDSTDNTHDFSLAAGDTVGFNLSVRFGATQPNSVITLFPGNNANNPSLFGDIVISGGDLSGTGRATIDGTLSPGEWDNADSTTVILNTPDPGTVSATIRAMNDADTLYFSVSYARGSLESGTNVNFLFDGDNDGTVFENGDDLISVTFTTVSFFTDRHIELPSGGVTDTTQHGDGIVVNSGGTTVFELAHPINSGDTQDIALSLGDTNGFRLSTFIGAANTILNPTTNWGTITLVIDNVAPSAPTIQYDGTDTGNSPTDKITSDDTPTFSGTAEAGSTVQLLDSGTPISGAFVTADLVTGAWSITTSALADGAHPITAQATDIFNNTGAASSQITVTIDTEDPVLTVEPDTVVNTSDDGFGNCTVVSWFVFGVSPFATDNIDSNPIELQTGGLGSGSCYPVGITTNTFTATDDAGNVDNAQFTITVIDDEPPSQPTNEAPTDGFDEKENLPFFNWSDSTDNIGVDHYTLEIDTDSGFSDPILQTHVINPESLSTSLKLVTWLLLPSVIDDHS